MIHWPSLTLALASHWRVVHLGTQILWITPHAICGSWIVQSPAPVVAMYAHEGD